MERELQIMRMTTSTMESIRADTKHTICTSPEHFPVYDTTYRAAASLAMPAKTLAQPEAAFGMIRHPYGTCRGLVSFRHFC
jgi:hypothetical protein